MPEGITLKRIIDMDEAAELTSSDYALVDSATGGPKKFALGNEHSSLKEDLGKIPFIDITNESDMIDTSKLYRFDGAIWYYNTVNEEWRRVGSGSGSSDDSTSVLPVLYLNGDISSMTKYVKATLAYTYVDNNIKEQKTGWLTCKWQGQSSLSYPKKNFNLVFYHDALVARKDKIKFMEDCKESKWTAKANYIDHSMSRNIVSARIWTEMVKSRHTEPPTLLKNSPRYGAVDGYPIVIYINDEYQGLYTLNIKKEDFTFGMDEDNPLHCAICGDVNNNGDNTKALATEFRTASTSGWVVEVPDAFPVIDNGDGTTTNVSDGLISLISFVMNSTDEEFVANLNTKLDVESAIDYFIFTYFIGAFDNLARNLILLTYDGGTKWYCSAYDLDSTWGANAQGGLTFPATGRFQADYAETNSLLWQRMAECFGNEIYARYLELRETVLKLFYINREFTDFINSIPNDEYKADVDKWAGIPNKTSNGLDFILQFVTARATYVDTEMARLATPTAIQSVALSPTSLTFDKVIEYVPNPTYFNTPFINASDFEQYYYLANYTTRTRGQSGTDWCTPITFGYEYGAMILNPNGISIRAGCTYDDSDNVIVSTGYRASTDHILPFRTGRDALDYTATKCALQINGSNGNGVAVVNPKWITLNDSLIPSGSGDVRTGPIIAATSGSIVLIKCEPLVKTTSYYSAVCTYASQDASAASYIAQLSDTNSNVKAVSVTGNNVTYIGFKLNRAMINEGGTFEYVVIPSESDLYSMVDPGWEDQTVTAVYTPSDATVETVSWSIDDQSVATVSGNGKTVTVHAVANGSTTITCTATDTAGLSASGTANITVTTN